jgi:hypothetical protein
MHLSFWVNRLGPALAVAVAASAFFMSTPQVARASDDCTVYLGSGYWAGSYCNLTGGYPDTATTWYVTGGVALRDNNWMSHTTSSGVCVFYHLDAGYTNPSCQVAYSWHINSSGGYAQAICTDDTSSPSVNCWTNWHH